MKAYDLLSSASIRNPGGGPVLDGGVIPVDLNPRYKICRLTFELHEPIVFGQECLLKFGFFSDNPDLVRPDIKEGDVGFPEIQVESENGCVYRFKRGNIKDFLDVYDLKTIQTVTIPYSSFIYNIDLKSNKSPEGSFFDLKIKKICFDFLSSSSSNIRVYVVAPSILGGGLAIDLYDLVQLEPINKLRLLPPSVSYSKAISFSVRKSGVAPKLLSTRSELKLEWRNLDENDSGCISVGEGKVYFELPLKKFGRTSFEFRVFSQGECVSRAEVGYVRLPYSRSSAKEFLGISDEHNFEGSSFLGCNVHRFVINLTKLAKRSSSGGGVSEYAFLDNHDPTKVLQIFPNCRFIVALKGMPRWLSSRPDQPDFYRYRPCDLSEYKDVLAWLFRSLNRTNVLAVESFNEANVVHEWNDDIDALRGMQEAFYCEAKRLGCKFMVLSPSSTTWDFPYFDKLRSINVYDHCDGIALHGYTYSPSQCDDYFLRLERLFDDMGEKKKRFYITEIGFRSPTFSDLDVATYFSLFTIRAFFSRAVRNIMWFRFSNPRPESLSFYDQNASSGYAMIGYNGSYARSSIASFVFLNSFIELLVPKDIVGVGPNLMFLGEVNGKAVLISYSEDGSHGLLDERLEGGGYYYDVFGNSVKRSELLLHKFIYVFSVCWSLAAGAPDE